MKYRWKLVVTVVFLVCLVESSARGEGVFDAGVNGADFAHGAVSDGRFQVDPTLNRQGRGSLNLAAMLSACLAGRNLGNLAGSLAQTPVAGLGGNGIFSGLSPNPALNLNPGGAGSAPPPPGFAAAPTGKGDATPLLKACAGCHDGRGTNGAPPAAALNRALDPRNAADKALAGRAFSRVNDGSMPPNAQLSDADRQAVLAYLQGVAGRVVQ